MKKICMTMVVAALAAVACSKNEIPEAVSNHPDSFSVAMTDLQNGDVTKTGLVEDGGKYNKLVWSSGDQLYITTTGELGAKDGTNFTYATYVTSDSGTTEASFSKKAESIEIPGTGNYVVVYTKAIDYGPEPDTYGVIGKLFNSTLAAYLQASVPVNQNYVANGIEPYAMPMYAYGADLADLHFTLLGNVVRLNLNNTGANTIKITSITLSTESAAKNDVIAGPFAFTIATQLGTPETAYGIWSGIGTYAKGSNHVTYTCSGDGVELSSTATAFNIVISRFHNADSAAGGETDIKATINYTVNGEAQTPKQFTLSSLNQTKRAALGKIYSFNTKDTKDW